MPTLLIGKTTAPPKPCCRANNNKYIEKKLGIPRITPATTFFQASLVFLRSNCIINMRTP